MTSPRKLSQSYVEARTAAAKWIFAEQRNAQWWSWLVLTKHNTAPNSLNIDDTLAFHIFIDLEHRGLLVPATFKGQPGYHLNLGNKAAWDEVMSPPSRFALWAANPLKARVAQQFL